MNKWVANICSEPTKMIYFLLFSFIYSIDWSKGRFFLSNACLLMKFVSIKFHRSEYDMHSTVSINNHEKLKCIHYKHDQICRWISFCICQILFINIIVNILNILIIFVRHVIFSGIFFHYMRMCEWYVSQSTDCLCVWHPGIQI